MLIFILITINISYLILNYFSFFFYNNISNLFIIVYNLIWSCCSPKLSYSNNMKSFFIAIFLWVDINIVDNIPEFLYDFVFYPIFNLGLYLYNFFYFYFVNNLEYSFIFLFLEFALYLCLIFNFFNNNILTLVAIYSCCYTLFDFFFININFYFDCCVCVFSDLIILSFFIFCFIISTFIFLCLYCLFY